MLASSGVLILLLRWCRRIKLLLLLRQSPPLRLSLLNMSIDIKMRTLNSSEHVPSGNILQWLLVLSRY